jgi:ubiquinone/menaquinone biosynthesis C-methylase UbiE
MTSTPKRQDGYLHGFTPEEQDRLARQARFLEHEVHDRLPFRRCRRLLEVGCGVGAQTEILLRHFPELHVTGLDASEQNLANARRRLSDLPWADGRWELLSMDATKLELEQQTFDAAFLCWILEHVSEPARVLGEVRRVLVTGSPVVLTEVQNATLYLDPYSPHTMTYWTAFNEHQMELGGDPFVGAKLGNLLQAVGFHDIQTQVRTFYLDNRQAGERAEFLAFWSELLVSGAEGLLTAGRVTSETVEGMKNELADIAHDPDAVFFYSFVQGRARAL